MAFKHCTSVCAPRAKLNPPTNASAQEQNNPQGLNATRLQMITLEFTNSKFADETLRNSAYLGPTTSAVCAAQRAHLENKSRRRRVTREKHSARATLFTVCGRRRSRSQVSRAHKIEKPARARQRWNYSGPTSRGLKRSTLRCTARPRADSNSRERAHPWSYGLFAWKFRGQINFRWIYCAYGCARVRACVAVDSFLGWVGCCFGTPGSNELGARKVCSCVNWS